MVLQSDLRLAAHPRHALFFGVFAIYIYGALAFGLAHMVFPDFAVLLEVEDAGAVNILWGVQALLFAGIFAHMTFWAQGVGAGPFAAPIRTTWKWIIASAIGGPVVYSAIIAFSYYVVAGGSENWAYTDPEMANTAEIAVGTVIMFAAVVVAAPVFEEVAYRGIAMGAILGRGLPPAIAVLLPAFVFAMTHTQYKFAALFAIFLFGVCLGVLRLKSKSIAPPIIAHMSVNFFQLIGPA